jgi:tight adherence protein B
VLVERLSPPVSDELARVTRALNLGLPIKAALQDMAERVGSDDLDLVVIAISVQHDIGGNLAETLEIISDTVQDRLRILREIRVLTAQQRFTGFVLALLPLAAGLVIFTINPEYISRLFAPGWVRLLPVAAVFLQLLGYLIISRIVDIEV